MGRVHLAGRGLAPAAGADAQARPPAGRAPDRVPEGERVVPPLRAARAREQRTAAHRWWGERKMGLMLGVLNARGEVAVVGRRGKQRVWDLAERWYPETERLTW